MEQPLLSVRNLRIQFATDDGLVSAVDGISFQLKPGGTIGIVENPLWQKCHLFILWINPDPPGKVSGEIVLLVKIC